MDFPDWTRADDPVWAVLQTEGSLTRFRSVKSESKIIIIIIEINLALKGHLHKSELVDLEGNTCDVMIGGFLCWWG